MFTSATVLHPGFPYFGQHGTYHAGGYNVPLGKTRASGLRLATFLQQRGWLDERTRAVIVELILYNPHANLFSMVTLVVEFTNLGAAYRGAEVVTLRLMQQEAILLLALRAVLAVFILVFVIKEGKGFSMLEIVDRIIVFEKGRVVADATKEEILKRMNNNG